MVLEVVKLIQASLALWGLFPLTEGVEVDGLFCDETKRGMEDWRRVMGWREENADVREVSSHMSMAWREESYDGRVQYRS